MALAQADSLKQQGRWAEALAGLQQASQRLDERDGQVSRDVGRALAELWLVGRLEVVRLRAAPVAGGDFAWSRADGEYESEFRTAGLGGPDEPAEAVAARVRVSGVRAALVAALDAWALTTQDRRLRDWARSVARSADESSDWGQRLRSSWGDRAVLERLARDAPVERLSPHLLGTLALALDDPRETVALLRKAQLHYPGDFWLTYFLAERLNLEGENAEAAGFYRAALSLRPDTPAVLLNLGFVLHAQKQAEEAIACFRKAIALDPKYAAAHTNLGNALKAKGQVEEAIACYRQAIALDPKNARAHSNLGHALSAKGEVEEAIACYHKALALDPKHSLAHAALGQALLQKGEFQAAQKSLRRCLGLLPPGHRLGGAMSRLVEQCQQMLEVGGKLQAFLDGKGAPADAVVQAQMAVLAQQPHKRLYLTAARLYRDAFARQPRLADALTAQHRYNAACAAALAGCGQGDAASRSDADRAGWRRQALHWLRAELAAWSRLAASGDVGPSRLARVLAHWQQDKDLAGLRDESALARLPHAERQPWLHFWSEVQRLLDQGRGAPAAPPRKP
jgi:tetratricopeptide (TPR) repeat protein